MPAVQDEPARKLLASPANARANGGPPIGPNRRERPSRGPGVAPRTSTAGPGEAAKAASRVDRHGLRDVRGLVPGDDVGGNAPALTHREPIRLRPSPDLRTVLAVRGRSPRCARWPSRCLTGLRRIAADRFIEPF